MEITGKIIAALPEEGGVAKTSGKPWRKRNYILETQETYPKKVCFNLFGDRIDQYGALLAVGNDVTVSFDIESREFNGRWYTDIRGYKVDAAGGAAPAAAAPAYAAPSAIPGDFPPAPVDLPAAGPAEDLPF
ncbi:MAG: DUF3127 domain-containing protein [Bacteroides sp.]|nr:DUF3127 domain-containing protein [Bacteroidales bacterium]MBD5326384.1 DUF3127 domain-containing protein [Bacteroides sp.]MDE6818408.1 DUF3127 domain-containing protein [Muribaculaceae bacterium]MBD5188202.1 DUF3127 domain-containing protein [Bacteroidales bacterium]MBD5416043.1 DUF3127 domain-containing protein [Bacteroides sp.]